MVVLALLLAAAPVSPVIDPGPSGAPPRQPPSVTLTSTRLAAFSGMLLSTAPLAAGVTSAFMYPYAPGTRGTAQGLALAAGFSSALIAIPWSATGFRFDGPGRDLRIAGVSFAAAGLTSSTVMLFASSPLVGENGVSDGAFEAWAIGQGLASATALMLMSWGSLQYGSAHESEEQDAAVRVTMMMRVLIPASGGAERPLVAGFMGRF